MSQEFEQVIANLTPDIVQNLKRAVELGKWPDGRQLTQEQRETCLQAVIAYEHRYVEETERTGYVPPKDKTAGEKTKTSQPDTEQPIKWRTDNQ